MSVRVIVVVLALSLAATSASAQKPEAAGCVDDSPAKVRETACTTALGNKRLSDKQKSEFYFLRGVARLELGQKREGVEDLETAIRINPGNARAHRERGGAANRSGDLATALHHGRLSVELAPDSSNNFSALGDTYARLRDHRSAVASFDRAIELNANAAFARFRRYELHRELGNLGAAEQDLAWLLSQPPEVASKWGTVGYLGVRVQIALAARLAHGSLLGGLGREAEGEQVLNAIVQEMPRPFVYLARARFHALHGLRKRPRFSEAARDAREAARLDPSYPEAWLELSAHLRQTGDTAGALDALDRGLALAEWARANSAYLWDRAILLRTLSRDEEAVDTARAALFNASLFGPEYIATMMQPIVRRGYWRGQPPQSYSPQLDDALQACLIDPECM